MLSKINIWRIITDHLATLKDADKGRPGFSDFFLFLLLPCGGAVVIVFVFHKLLSDNLINILITSLSIFVGLLLNLLVIIFDIINKITERKTEELKKMFLREIYSNISFSILNSLITIGFLVVALIDQPEIKMAANVLADTFLILFGLTLLMILKRVHVLLSNEFKNDVGN